MLNYPRVQHQKKKKKEKKQLGIRRLSYKYTLLLTYLMLGGRVWNCMENSIHLPSLSFFIIIYDYILLYVARYMIMYLVVLIL